MDKVVISMDGTLGWRPSRGAAAQYFGPGEAVEVPVAAAKSFGRLPQDWQEGDELPTGVRAVAEKATGEGKEATPNATDAAIELAKAEGVDLALVTGTGDGGRIGKADVTAYLKSKEL